MSRGYSGATAGLQRGYSGATAGLILGHGRLLGFPVSWGVFSGGAQMVLGQNVVELGHGDFWGVPDVVRSHSTIP